MSHLCCQPSSFQHLPVSLINHESRFGCTTRAPAEWFARTRIDARVASLTSSARSCAQTASSVGLPASVRARPDGNITAYSVTSPELAAEILGQPDRFRQNGPGYRELRQALGENLLTSEDESWHRQRRFLAPSSPGAVSLVTTSTS